ncbi:MAG: CAP domain-containing protein, partial [Cellulosilyticaceae bacterium]
DQPSDDNNNTDSDQPSDDNNNADSDQPSDDNNNTDSDLPSDDNNNNTDSDLPSDDNNNIPSWPNLPSLPNKPTLPEIPSPPAIPDESPVDTRTQYENEVLTLVNKERQKAGLKPLQMDERVRTVAREKSRDMSVNNYFDHTSPTYGSPFDMLKKSGINYSSAAENIAAGYQTPNAVVDGWMNSPGHRKNILDGNLTHIGVGYYSTGNYWTQMFITPR